MEVLRKAVPAKPVSDGDRLRLLGRNVHSGRGNQLRIRYFRRNLDPLPAILFLRLGVKRHPVVIAQMVYQIVEIRGEAYCVAREADGIALAAGFLSQTREINLSPIVLPVAMAEMPHARVIDGVDHNAGSRGLVDSRVQVRILQITAPVIAIDS